MLKINLAGNLQPDYFVWNLCYDFCTKKWLSMRIKCIVTVLLVSLFVVSSCSKEGSDNNPNNNDINCSGAHNTFSCGVSPLVQGVCNTPPCHASGSTNGPGPLTNYTQVFNARAQIRSAISSGFMPQDRTFTSAQKSAFICWIDNGAQDN